MQLQHNSLKVVSPIHVLNTWTHHMATDSHEPINSKHKIGWASSPFYHIGSRYLKISGYSKVRAYIYFLIYQTLVSHQIRCLSETAEDLVEMNLKDGYLWIPNHPDCQHLQWEEIFASFRIFAKLLKPGLATASETV